MAAGKTHDFYIVVAPGLEAALELELRQRLPLLVGLDGQPLAEDCEIVDRDRGGILVRCSDVLGFQLNFHLRLASRVLIRLARFQAREFHQLEAQAKKAAPVVRAFWGGDLQLKVACARSVLNNEKRVAETLRKVFPVKDIAPETLHVRVHQNICELSLDTSGEHLHKRGWRAHHGGAPLRETLGAALVAQLCREKSPAYLRTVRLVDPFVGSGTLLREFAERLWPVERAMAFQKWNGVPKIMKSPSFFANYHHLRELAPVPEALGFDFDDEALDLARKHLGPLVEDGKIGALDLRKRDWSVGTLMDRAAIAEVAVGAGGGLGALGAPAEKTWVIANPPYGERKERNFDLRATLSLILSEMTAERLGLILPVDQERALKLPGWRVLSRAQTTNGGLPVSLSVWGPQIADAGEA